MTHASRSLATASLRSPSVWLAALALVVALVPGLGPLLELDRAALRGGELWRLVTGHLAHFSFQHLAWDAIALAALGALAERSGRRRVALALAGSALAIPLAVVLLAPELETYRGLSGLASCVFALLVVGELRAARGRWRALLLPGLVAAAFALKLGFELVQGSAVFVDSGSAGFVPVPLAHAVGAVVGVLAALWPSTAGERAEIAVA